MPVRLKAFFLHLGVSGIIAVLALLLVFKLWYPEPLHTAVGVTHIFLLLLLIDVALGPLLTLLVYKVGKKTLVLDLTVIAMLQLSALGYGLWAVAEGRPAWLVFNADRFDLVRVLDIDPRKLERALPEYHSPSWFGPRWVSAVLPSDNAERIELMFEAALGGSDLPQHPSFYRPLADARADIQSRSRPLAELQGFNPVERVQAVIAQWPEADAWLPLMAGTPMVVLLHKENAEVLVTVDLRPWL
ncbi:MAG: type IV pilin accessory protein [Gammaproteobacteria bacterium]|nr:type IV pilin accessory protein [Gammaproteobacteria bacterium]MBU0884287.1 type IV pilin accessory protein [Gammaproteobacteria bacterium]MBU1859182.1 type IV pilin accessory protein [Gammaproteobacteria bacterium]